MSASRSPVPLLEDDALSLVQAQYELSEVIFENENPVDILRALHMFTGNQFSTAQLAFTIGNLIPVTFNVVAEGASGAIRSTDRHSSLSDYPAADHLAALQSTYIPDVRDENTLPDAEREWLRSRGIRAVLVVPLVVNARLSGLILLGHDEPVNLSPARVRALDNAAAQLAVVVDNRRLLADAQTTTVQEQRINALVARFQSAASTEALLRMAITELGQSLGARAGAIRLATPTDVEGAAS